MLNFRNLSEDTENKSGREWFITSDTHFFHRSILKFYPNRKDRFGDNVAEMNETMVETWNLVCGKNANIFHLGDLSFGKARETEELVSRLNGHIFVVPGNHDPRTLMNRLNRNCKNFTLLDPYVEFQVTLSGDKKKTRMCLCHYPLMTWNSMWYGALHFHGHCHGSLDKRNDSTSRFDVGYDANPFLDGPSVAPLRFFDSIRSAKVLS